MIAGDIKYIYISSVRVYRFEMRREGIPKRRATCILAMMAMCDNEIMVVAMVTLVMTLLYLQCQCMVLTMATCGNGNYVWSFC